MPTPRAVRPSGFLVRFSGLFQDAEMGNHTRRWTPTNDAGRTLVFRSRAAAQLAIDGLSSSYDGVAYYNVLSHGQLSGDPAAPIRIRGGRLPFYAEAAWAYAPDVEPELHGVTLRMDAATPTYDALTPRGRARFCALYAEELRARGFDARVSWSDGRARFGGDSVEWDAPADVERAAAFEFARGEAFARACGRIGNSYLK